MKFEVRKAILSDVDFIASAMIKSSRLNFKEGFFDFLFGNINENELLANVKKLLTNSTKLYCNYENFVVASSSKKIVGILCGYESKLFSREKFIEILKSMNAQGDYENTFTIYDNCIGDIPKHTWMLDFLVVEDGIDEFEISNALLNKSLLSARLKGFRQVRTVVEIESTEVNMMYKNLGFTLKNEIRNDYYEELFHSSGCLILELHL